VESGDKLQAPGRVLFQWGSFEFIGMVQSYDETLDFFSPKGRPLRATVALKLSEDRYQFRDNDSDALAAQQTPELAFTGNGAAPDGDPGNGAPPPNQNSSPVPGGSDGAGSWRDNAMFNGIESPRLPSATTLALPSVSLGATGGFGISGGAGIGLSTGVSISGGIGASLSLGLNSGSSRSSTGGPAGSSSPAGSAARPEPAPVAPAFKYGNSSALGTGVPGAFHANPKASLKASNLQLGSVQLRAPATVASANGSAIPAAVQTHNPRTAGSGNSVRQHHGISVASLLKRSNDGDSGVGFD
jgi:hypothetical protein